MALAHYYFDTSSIFDLDAYGLIRHLCRVYVVVVPEVMEEILDCDLKRQLLSMRVDSGTQERTVSVSDVNFLDSGESAVIKTMACDQGRGWRRIYVSKDAASHKFVGTHQEDI